MLRGLVQLIRQMDGLTGPAEIEEVRELLRAADVDREDMVQACKFSDVRYARTHLAKGPWYELLVICWKQGQSSPIHDHIGSTCGVRVVDGIATETIYEESSPGFVHPVSQRTLGRGEVTLSSDATIHLITNQHSDLDLVTLHLYTPPLAMRYYELEEAQS